MAPYKSWWCIHCMLTCAKFQSIHLPLGNTKAGPIHPSLYIYITHNRKQKKKTADLGYGSSTLLLFVSIVLICAISIRVKVWSLFIPQLHPSPSLLAWHEFLCNVATTVWTLTALLVVTPANIVSVFRMYKGFACVLCLWSVRACVCVRLCCVFLWFSGRRRILVTRRTSEIYSRCSVAQPASNSSSSRGRNAVCPEAWAERTLIL